MYGGAASHFGDLRMPGIGLGSVSSLGPGPFSFPHTVTMSPVTAQGFTVGPYDWVEGVKC